MTSNTTNTNKKVLEWTDGWKAFSKNRRNFLEACWSADELRSIDSEVGLAQKFGYSDQEFARIKALAAMQFCEEWFFEDGKNGGVFLEEENDGIMIGSPWMDDTGRWELTDEGAINFYGEEFVRAWCKKASENLKQQELLSKLKNWTEKTTYVPKYPFKNPIEQYGLVW